MKTPKVALAHEFLVQYGGAEKTFEAIAELYPDAPVFTAKYDSKYIPKLSPILKDRKIISPQTGVINQASKYLFTFMMAPVFEDMDFREYDLILSDGNTWNKGIITRPDQLHITYVHTPPRFLYKYSTESTKRDKWYFKIPFSYVDNILRMWDFISAQRPDYMLANSIEVQNRIQKFYRREAEVINPPVEVEYDLDQPREKSAKPYFITVGRLNRYKNFDLVINAFNMLKKALVVVGTGEYESYLKSIAGPTISFVGAVSNEEKHRLIHNAMGLINPVVDEDFGIVPVEASMHGIPVLAHKSGGHLETIQEGSNGMFFEEINIDSFIKSFVEFEKNIEASKYDKSKIAIGAEKYSKKRFQQEYKKYVDDKWEKFITKSA